MSKRCSVLALCVLVHALPASAQRALVLEDPGVAVRYDEPLDARLGATVTVIVSEDRDDAEHKRPGPTRFSHICLKRGVSRFAGADFDGLVAGDVRGLRVNDLVRRIVALIEDESRASRDPLQLELLAAAAQRLSSATALALTASVTRAPSSEEAAVAEALIARAGNVYASAGAAARSTNRRDVRSTVGWRVSSVNGDWQPDPTGALSFELHFDRYEDGPKAAGAFDEDPAWKKGEKQVAPPPRFPELGVLQFGRRILFGRSVACDDAELIPGGLGCRLGDDVRGLDGADLVELVPAYTRLSLRAIASVSLGKGPYGASYVVERADRHEVTVYSEVRALEPGSWMGETPSGDGDRYMLVKTTGLATTRTKETHKLQSGFIYATAPAKEP